MGLAEDEFKPVSQRVKYHVTVALNKKLTQHWNHS